MAPRHTLAAFLSFAAAASAQSSMFWTYTSRYADFLTVSAYTREFASTTAYYTYTDTRTVKPTVTPTATPKSTSTYIQSYYDLKLVYQYYGVGAVAESDLLPERNYLASTTSATSTEITSSITFFMPVTMSAPASCPTQFTVTTTASVSVPSQVYAQVTPTSTRDGGLTTRAGGYVYTYQTWWLSAGAAPFTTTSDYYYRYYIASCSMPPTSRASATSTARAGGGNSGSSDSGSSVYCSGYYYYCGTPLKTWIIIIASVIPGLFLLGILESWFWFRRLMRGKSAMRFGTVSWILISLWVLCFTRMQDARSKEDQKVLQEKWKVMGSGAAFKAWMKWGFRHAYPVEHLGQFSKQTVGVVPTGQSLYPAMAQAPMGFAPGAPPPPGAPGQVYYYSPPPGWVPTPDGQGFMPPPGYVYPPPQQPGYYAGDMSKAGTAVSTSPVSAIGSQHLASGPQQQASVPSVGTTPQQSHTPQPVYPAQNVAQMPAPSPPPQGPVPSPPPLVHVSEAPATPARLPQPPPPKNDPNDRSLYE